MTVLDSAPLFLAGWLFEWTRNGSWRRHARWLLRRLELGLPLRGDRFEHRLRADIARRVWRHDP